MLTSPPPPILSFAPIFINDEYSAESNEKSIFRVMWFLFFELWLIYYVYNLPNIYRPKKNVVQKWRNLQKRKYSENYFLGHEFFFYETFSFWDMIDFDVRKRDFCEPDSDANQWSKGPQSKNM